MCKHSLKIIIGTRSKTNCLKLIDIYNAKDVSIIDQCINCIINDATKQLKLSAVMKVMNGI